MAVKEQHIEKTVAELIKVYHQTGEHLKKQVLSVDLTDFQKARANELIKQIDSEIAALNAVVYQWSKTGIPKAYERGMDISGAQLSEMGVKHSLNMGNVIHRSSVQVISDQMALDLIQANGTMGTTLQQYIRKTQQNVVTERLLNRKIGQGLISGEARRDTSDRILQELKKNIVDGAMIKAGSRNFKPETYAELVARTRTREAVTQGAINTGVEFDIELFQVSVHENPCPVCQQFQGRVYSITGSNSDFPKLTQKPPFHPHCRHVLVPVTEGFLKRRGIYEALSSMSNDPDADVSSNEAYKAYVKVNTPKPEPGRKLPKPIRDELDPPVPAPVPEPIPEPIPEPVPVAVRTIDMVPRGITGAEEFGEKLSQAPGVKLGGSTGARMYVDDEGTHWVVKAYNGRAEQAQNEFLANRIYALNKVNVPEARLAMVDGNLSIALRYIDAPGAKIVGSAGAQAASKLEAVRKGFAVDAFVANWDVAGLDFDNIMHVPGKSSMVWRLDQGGSLLFRAQGSPKGNLFGEVVNELSSLRDASINPNTAKLFSGIDDKKLLGYYRNLLQYTKPEALAQLIEEAGFTGTQAAELKRILVARLNYIRKMRHDLAAKLKAAEQLAKTATSGGVSIPGRRRTLPHANTYDIGKEIAAAVPKEYEFQPKQLSELKSFTGSFSKPINDQARLQGKYKANLDNLLASDTLPGWNGFTQRMVGSISGRDKKLENFKSGRWAHEEWVAYSSSSIKPGGTYGNHVNGWNYIIKNRGIQGGYVDPVSSVPGEKELLYGRNSKFRVIGWDYGYNYNGSSVQGHYLFLEEIQGDIPDSQEPPPQIDIQKFMAEWDRRWKAGQSSADLDPLEYARK